jgi:hypothetical protein
MIFIRIIVILTIVASESAIGLSILTLSNYNKNTITFDVVKNQNFNLSLRKRRDLNPQYPCLISSQKNQPTNEK